MGGGKGSKDLSTLSRVPSSTLNVENRIEKLQFNKISDYIPILWTIRKRGELSSYDVVFTFVRIEVRIQMVQ